MANQQQQRADRRRGIILFAICLPVALALMVAAMVPLFEDTADDPADPKDETLIQIGATRAKAGCQTDVVRSASGSGVHLDPGKAIDYPHAPPAFGRHARNFLTDLQRRSFFTRRDRPPVEQLVHSLEHGHSLLWYDSSITQGTDEWDDLRAIADKLKNDPFFNIVPWTSTDGGDFPSGTHLALTHWTGPKNQTGVWRYCEKPSGRVVQDWRKKYPRTNAPEDVPRG